MKTSVYQKFIIGIFLIFNILCTALYWYRHELPYNESGIYIDLEGVRHKQETAGYLGGLCLVAWAFFLLFIVQIVWKSRKKK
jgi:hypothetical protein